MFDSENITFIFCHWGYLYYLCPLKLNISIMKKRVLLALFSLGACLGVSAQNVQLHYDLGRSLYDGLSSRGSVTTTVEMFKPDKWGSTFMFTDLDYKNDRSEEHTSELQSRQYLVCRLLLEKKK